MIFKFKKNKNLILTLIPQLNINHRLINNQDYQEQEINIKIVYNLIIIKVFLDNLMMMNMIWKKNDFF